MTKFALRHALKKQRALLAPEARLGAIARIGELWQTHPRVKAATKIGSYNATPLECPTQALHAASWQQQQQIFIPQIDAPGQWAELTAQSVLQKTALGIFEPIHTPTLPTDDLDIILVPLLGIDQQGYRLGYGGGFYDRVLAKSLKKPYLIGLGFQQQCTDSLPHDPWDIPLDAFLSEQGWLFFTHPQATI